MDPDLSPGWTLNEDWIRRLAILDWMAQQTEAATEGRLPDLSPLVEESGDDPQADRELGAHVEFMAGRGWVTLFKAMGGYRHCSFQVTPQGFEYRNEVDQRRGSPIARRKAAREALLLWLYEVKLDTGHPPTISSFGDSRYGYFYGQAFTVNEIDEAGAWLYDRGYIKGTRASGMKVPPRPSITPEGEDLMEAGKSVNEVNASSAAEDAPLAVPTWNVHVQDSKYVNVIAGSPGATQRVTLTQDDRSQLMSVAETLEQAGGLLGLDAAARRELGRAAQELRDAAVDAEPDVGRVRTLLAKIGQVVVAGGTSGINAAVAGQVQHALEGLPGVLG